MRDDVIVDLVATAIGQHAGVGRCLFAVVGVPLATAFERGTLDPGDHASHVAAFGVLNEPLQQLAHRQLNTAVIETLFPGKNFPAANRVQ
ncbi:hypothetical protein D3C87_1862710 [compost metagenome]